MRPSGSSSGAKSSLVLKLMRSMLLPSSFGLSFAAAPGTERVLVTASWGRYEKVTDEEKPDKDGKPSRWWQPGPVSGSFELTLNDGLIDAVVPAPHDPDVVRRATWVGRAYARYVTLFLVCDPDRP